MLNRSRVLGISLLLIATAVTAFPDQPRMNAARADLNKAKAESGTDILVCPLALTTIKSSANHD